MDVAALFSGGKDSTLALHRAAERHDIKALISVHSSNKDSWMFHTPNIRITSLQAEVLGLPLIMAKTRGVKEEELLDLERAIRKAVDTYSIDGVVSGAIYSEYQKSRIDGICEKLGVSSMAPLWHADLEEYMAIVAKDFQVVITHVAAEGFDKGWLGRTIDMNCVRGLKELNKRFGINIAGEGGEYETLVLDAPMFKKRLAVGGKKEWRNSVGSYLIDKARLLSK